MNSEKLIDLFFWIILPGVRLTEKNGKKWVRVIGFLTYPATAIIFSPLWIPVFFLMIFSVVWEEI